MFLCKADYLMRFPQNVRQTVRSLYKVANPRQSGLIVLALISNPASDLEVHTPV
jgi:hypothetical protein